MQFSPFEYREALLTASIDRRIAVEAYSPRESDAVRVQVLTYLGALDRAKQLAVVEQFTEIVADAASRPELRRPTWVLLTETPDGGGWGPRGHAHTNAELVAAPRAEAAGLAGGAGE